MPASLTDMVAVSADSGVKPLGYITWFSVPDRAVPLKKLRTQWMMAGLDPKCLPPDPRALHTFKHAMREQDGREATPEGHIIETDVRAVDENGTVCIYQISRVVKDRENEVVEYPKAMRVTYKKMDSEIVFKALGDVPKAELLPMMEAITDYFEQNAKMIGGSKVRTLVRQFLRDDADEEGGVIGLSGENLRGKGGGIYFVDAKFKAELDSVAEALEGLYPENAAYLYTVPLADGASERELIRRHHVANTKKEIMEAIADVAALLRADRKAAIRSDVIRHHERKLNALRRRAALYNELLKEEQEDVSTAAGMLALQLEKLPV